MKLSDKAVAGLSLQGKSELIVFDDAIPGFGVRLREGGSRTWVFQYKIGAKHRRIKMGAVSAMKAHDARATAERYHAQVNLGQDPAGEKAIEQVKAADTFDILMREFLIAKRPRVRPRTYSEAERYLDLYCKKLHPLRVDKIDRAIVATVLNDIAKAGPIAANRARATLSSLFAWAMTQGKIEINPIIGTERRKETARERVLSDDELRDIWLSLEDDHFGEILRLLILTGQRRTEIAELVWHEIDFDAGMINLPPERTKNRREQVVPMSDMVAEILKRQPMRAGRDLLFGFGQGPYAGWSHAKLELDARIAARRGKPIAPWTIHDIRRSVATRMADLGVLPHVIEAVINHISGHKAGVAGIYNRSSYAAEKAAALAFWAEHVRVLVDGGPRKVIPMNSRIPA